MKITFVHRSLWDDFLRIASSKDGWQARGLSADAKHCFNSWKGKVR